MRTRPAIFLTGATGLLGRYLLRDLLESKKTVAVLVRSSRAGSAADRVKQLVSILSELSQSSLPQPIVFEGELTEQGLGLGRAEKSWLAARCRAALHAAACTSFQSAGSGDPWASNVEGTRHLLDFCAERGITEFHHISTAFVSGRRPGPVFEHELDCGQSFHNDYERSKCESELLVRSSRRVQATVFRPSVIVGDSRTGYTSIYQGFYYLAELLWKLSERGGPRAGADSGQSRARRRVPLRLPCTGDELHNLVPVDWVSQAICQIMGQPAAHGHTFHLVSSYPTTARTIKEITEAAFQIEGVGWSQRGGPLNPTLMERLFLAHTRDYAPYLGGAPKFDCRNTLDALPALPPPLVGAAMLRRLLEFAVQDRWGKCRSHESPPQGNTPDRNVSSPASGTRFALNCSTYLEVFFPERAPQSMIGRLANLNVTVGFDVSGPGGGQWSCRWIDGHLASVCRGLESGADLTYRTSVLTFFEVVSGVKSPQQAFFDREVEIRGDVEKALKLAVLFGHFVTEFPYAPAHKEVLHAQQLTA